MKYIFTLVAFLLFTHLQAQDTTQTVQKTACPCCTEAHSAFDFWVGNWETYDKSGKKLLGKNLILKMESNCVMQENWQSASKVYTGTSYNFYNQITKEWEQLWVDNQGSYLKLYGNLVDGSMVLSSKPAVDAQKRTFVHRVTWTLLEDGRVRQHWQTTYDEGKTWTSAFDGYYQRMKE